MGGVMDTIYYTILYCTHNIKSSGILWLVWYLMVGMVSYGWYGIGHDIRYGIVYSMVMI